LSNRTWKFLHFVENKFSGIPILGTFFFSLFAGTIIFVDLLFRMMFLSTQWAAILAAILICEFPTCLGKLCCIFFVLQSNKAKLFSKKFQVKKKFCLGEKSLSENVKSWLLLFLLARNDFAEVFNTTNLLFFAFQSEF